MPQRQKVSVCFWYNTEAEEAARFYVSLFEDSRITGVSHYGKGGPLPEGMVLTVTYTLAGTEFMGLNGGPHHTLSEAASMVVDCEDQAEIDRLWSALLADGGKENCCGWLKDRFGLSWQIVPKGLGKMIKDADAAKAGRVMAALRTMVKLDIAKLEAAFRGA
jgi:predicted 3-demethylubiquinone-9 3-methyltransferase (glyoxalase superfamily)